MGRLDRTVWSKRTAAIVGAAVLALSAALPLDARGASDDGGDAAQAGPELYRWLDRYGAVRYTPDLGRIPAARRDTVVRVIRSNRPPTDTLPAQPGAMTIPTPGQTPPSATATLGIAMPDADPFNAPGEQRSVRSQDLGTGAGFGGNSWPELDARIAELEVLVARDEETIKQMVSAPRSDDYDELIHSAELREIAARLPVLQGELNELRRWREEPDRR